MTADTAGALPSVIVVGGGLAGLAAAVALREAGCGVELFESRSVLGGRATSFQDPLTGELVDHCQHVGMGCCTNLADFCRRAGIATLFRRDRRLNFIGTDGRLYPFRAAPLLPAPLHLVPAFLSLGYLSLRDRLGIARAIWRMMRMSTAECRGRPVADWLAECGQSRKAVEGFWGVVLVSALGEKLEYASLSAARKVIVDGFLSSRSAYELDVPTAPLGTLYGQRLVEWLVAQGVAVRLSAAVRRVSLEGGPVVHLADGQSRRADFVVLAVPWTKLAGLVSGEIASSWPWLDGLSRCEGSPITGVHLWFDRSVTPLPHAVLVARLSQWVFNRGPRDDGGDAHGHYYQVVVSGSQDLRTLDRKEVITKVCAELASVWPDAAAATLLHARVVTEPAAVISPRPNLERVQPTQSTSVPGIALAGDWTATGWPATMEAAVRSGYLAAEAVLKTRGHSKSCLARDLPRSLLARLLIKD
jgi:squalene-associated FAD-dependent desaturase